MDTTNLRGEINKLFYTTGILIYETDMQHGDGRNYWPFHPVFLDSLVAPFVFDELDRLFRILERRGYSIEEIAKLIKSPTRVANYQYLWPIATLKETSFKKKKYLTKIFVKLLEILRNGETYCEKFRNPVWGNKEVEKYLNENKKYLIEKNKNPGMARILAKFEGLIMSYCEILYYYMLDLSRLFHGPYQYRDKTVFAKEFLDLKASEMWDLVKDFPFNHFQEVGVYPKEMQIQIFFMGHSHANPSFPEAIESFILKLDGKPITDLVEMKKYYQSTNRIVNKTVKYLSANMSNEEFLLKRGLDLFFYPLRSLYEEIGEDWRKILPQVYKFAKKNKSKIKIPNPWGDWDVYKAAKFLFKMMYRNTYGRRIGQKEFNFIKEIEKLSRGIHKKEPSLPQSYSLVKALNLV